MLVGRIGAGAEPDFLPLVQSRALRMVGEAGWSGVFQVAAGQLATALAGMAALGFTGASIAGPHQREVAQLCELATPTVRALGRAGFVSFEGGKLRADHARPLAIASRIRALAPEAQELTLVGAGPDAAAVVLAASELGLRKVSVAAAPRFIDALLGLAPGLQLQALEPSAPLAGELVILADPDAARITRPLDPARVRALIELQAGAHGLSSLALELRAAGAAVEDGTATLVREGLLMLEAWRGAQLPEALEARVRAVVRAGGASVVGHATPAGAPLREEPRQAAVSGAR